MVNLKPSDLLNKMQDLSCNKVGDDLLKILWLQRLPNNIQSVLACSSDPLETLSTMADKIFATSNNTSIQGIAKTNSDLTDAIYKIEDKINALNKKIDMSRPRIKSKSPHRFQTYSSVNDICWYHKTYKHKAKTQCDPPCAFVTKSKNGSQSQTRRLTPTRK